LQSKRDALVLLMMLVRSLKGIQLAVAIATTLALGAGFLWPGAMGLFLVPLALLYVIWAIRAALNHRLSIWLSFASTITIAVFLGAFGVSIAVSTFRAGDPNDKVIPLVAMDAAGNVAELPPEALPRLQQVQAQIDRRDRVHASLLLLIGLGAWLVVGLYALEWRWAFVRKAASESRSAT
jgi:4-amino-4-deoxy-L-arabinose transferase-like glycosyltransferase